MIVGKRMTKDPITVTPDTSVDKALQLMRRERVRRFPVVDKHGKLVGMVSEKDLLYASPSPATTLSIYEMAYLLSKITVREVMATDVITVGEDVPLEEAARVMADNKIGSLPVVRGDQLVGIITETDMFKVFLEVFGARVQGVRLTLQAPDRSGVLARIAGAIAELGGNIAALGTAYGDEPGTTEITIRVSDVPRSDLVQAMEALADGITVLEARECDANDCRREQN